ncbi:hypothetical protein BH09PAT1_BH09PAT1_2330 [soil metagenome]
MSKTFNLPKEVFQEIFSEHSLGDVISVKELHGGYANPAFLVNDKYVVRFNSDIKEDRKDCFLRENILYTLFPNLNIPAPQAIAVNINKDKVPYYYIINSYVKGDILSSAYNSFTDEDKHIIAFHLGELLQKIHSIHLDIIGDSTKLFNWRLPWKEVFLNTFDKTYKEFNDHGNLLPEEDKKVVEDTYSQFKEQISDNDIPIGLVHNDFHANHVVVEHTKITGIIDFEWASFGDPLYDLQKLPINLSIDGEFYIKDFLKGYGLTKFSDKELLRFKMYCVEQGTWMIDRTRHGTHGFPKEGIEQGYELIKNINTIVL